MDRENFAELLSKAIQEKYPNECRAAVARELGISKQSLSTYLHGKSLPGAEMLAKILPALDLSFDDIASVKKCLTNRQGERLRTV